MDTIPIGIFWRAMSWLPGFLLRRFFSKQWLAQHTRIDIRSRHDPVSVRAGELPELHIWLVISNHGHFLIELDRLTAEFIFGGMVIRTNHLVRAELKPDAELEIFLRDSLTREQVEHIQNNKERPYIALQVQAEFNSKVHNFPVNTGQLSGIKPELINL